MDFTDESTKQLHELWRQKCKEELVNNRCKLKHVHSLTARTVPNRQGAELNLPRTNGIIKLPIGGGKELLKTDGEVVNIPGSPRPQPGTIKTILAFYESLATRQNDGYECL